MLQKQGINSNNLEFTISPANDGVGRGFKQQKWHYIFIAGILRPNTNHKS
jgi:hypothetical protein